MRFRGTTIRRKIVALLLIPLVSLTAIWAFAATLTGRQVWGLFGVEQTVNALGYPVEDSIQALQQERRSAMLYLADPRRSDARGTLLARERETDKVIARLRGNAASGANRERLAPDALRRLDLVVREFGGLETLRDKVGKGTIGRNDAFAAYSGLFDPAYAFLDSLNPLNNVAIDKQGRALIQVTRAREAISQEDALMVAAIAAGRMSAAEMRSFTFAVAEQRAYYADNLHLLTADERALYDAYWAGPSGRALRAAEDAVISAGASGAPQAADRASWQTTATTALTDLDRLGVEAGDLHKKRAEPIGMRLVAIAAVAGGLGLIAVVASVFVSIRVGRSLIRDLSRLRKEAQEVSGARLPRVMRRLAAGEEVDVETEAPRLDYPDDEVGQVGKAVNTLQRAAVEAAVRQSEMRRGVSEVFVNLARRSQVLLHRQLTLLDAMERRTEDPQELADLFRLDHMTTRMRRHAEGLVILSGAVPSRQWRKPVQLMDVVRAAVAEVEDYERVDVRRLPRLAVTGHGVADLTHLIAELIENATVFSPPHTSVQVHGESVANGFVLEIDDRGLGLTPDAMLEANLRLAETPEFELSDTDRLGLFVVSRLAQRQGVRVSLRQSPYGGTTAVVFVPASLLTESGEDQPDKPLDETLDGPRDETAVAAVVEARAPAEPDEPRVAPMSAATEHSFRQWGLVPEPDDEPREHRPHVPETVGTPALTAAPDAVPADAPTVLPRRRRTPVLVAENGRPVGEAPRPADPAPQEEPAGAGLPRRVRQASLAPQLRSDSTTQTRSAATGGADDDGGHERSPEEVRDRMASLQRGWLRGRADTADDLGTDGTDDVRPTDRPGTTPAERGGDSATRSTTEGNGP
ncbi:nitrate- and nitrite sensing domain-containing protein [Streptomyces sp. PA03-1a]|nr:nitrate- and nitrite sensing domain-containing protein [Streptomyces sp. PA03-1a]MDX2819272.1 nitrate- and nitrite sensing domain-containing protein [Streptomyces sp. PA03-5A]